MRCLLGSSVLSAVYVWLAMASYGHLWLQPVLADSGVSLQASKTHDSMSKPVEVSLEKEESLEDFASKLMHKGVIKYPLLFIYYVKLFDDFREAKSGTYHFNVGAEYADIMDKIRRGESVKKLTLSVTIPEGFSLTKVVDRLERLQVGNRKELLSLVADEGFLKSLGISAPSIEGYVYPETYQFFEVMPSAQEVLERMVQQFFMELPDGYEQAAKSRGLTLHEAVIFASLIEKETAVEKERSKISEVIWNRLKDKIPLGIDAAIIYGIDNFDGDLTFADLKNKRNPYNTRVHRGLPISPIGAVSRASLKAVLSPTSFGYYYYVLKGNGSGEHAFSRSLSQHNRYVKRLLQNQNKKR
ncbi:MAG: endolytic transglycosylase MltG [Proteobacteria bacterium]|nr:endolytic transglycosylase MltG [Pseudomonadota bacterium]